MASLSRVHRPQTFADITGQRHITETLRKEVATGTLAHAYLFSGPRGVGKTTSARVFAKALNCNQPKEGEPCNACDPCAAANEGRFLDLIELDAATHTGVDTVRESIIEHVRFAPVNGKRKIYVLDEAHMLSTSSWNALLKTLEEPPEYAFFILATTEWHKVPATIVSRCQRFEFKRVADEVLAERVRELAKLEQWNIDEEVVKLIVSRSEGCVRDAETLLGQLGSLGEAKMDLALASLVIPPCHVPLAAALMGLWADRNHPAAFAEAQRLFDEGIPLLPLFDDLILIIRKLLYASSDAQAAMSWSAGTEEDRSVAVLVGRFTPEELHDLALMLFERRKDVKGGVDPLFALQLAGVVAACGMVKHASPPPVVPTEARRSGGTPLPSEAVHKAIPPLVVDSSAGMTKENHEIAASPVAPRNDEGKEMAPRNDEGKGTASFREEQKTEPSIEISLVRSKWQAIIRAVDEKNHSLPFILKISRPEAVQGSTIVIRFQYPFHKDKVVSDMKHRRVVEECLREVLGRSDLIIDGVIGEDADVKEQRSQDMVSNILKAFGGSVVE